MTCRKLSAFQDACRKSKLNAWLSSSGLMYRASRSGLDTQASATAIRSPG